MARDSDRPHATPADRQIPDAPAATVAASLARDREAWQAAGERAASPGPVPPQRATPAPADVDLVDVLCEELLRAAEETERVAGAGRQTLGVGDRGALYKAGGRVRVVVRALKLALHGRQ